MKITKAKNIFKKMFLALVLALIILAASIFSSALSIRQSNGSLNSVNAPVEEKEALYEVDVFYNLVILMSLSDVPQFNGEDLKTIDRAFNDISDPQVDSLREYFKEQSKDRTSEPLDIISVYMFCNSSTSASAFKALDKNRQVPFVNSALIEGETIWKDVEKKEPFTGNLDMNEDGLIDSITLYMPLSIVSYVDSPDVDTAAWPHAIINIPKEESTTFRSLKYNRFVVNSYKINNEKALIGTMCHEMLHNIGNDAPENGIQDLYHYSDETDPGFYNLTPVGNYCIMGSTDYRTPQPLNMYYKSKLGWATLREEESGLVTLSKTAAEGIKFGVKDSEFFVAQYWKENSYNGESPNRQDRSGAAGIIIYRVNTEIKTGNMNKKKEQGSDIYKIADEIYVFRDAMYSETSGNFPALKSGGFKNLTYSNGENVRAIISNITIGSDDVSFNIEKYALEFKIGGEFVPYEIMVKLNNNEWEKTSSGAFVFFKDDIAAGTIYFECFGYEFYKDSGLTVKIDHVVLNLQDLDDENLTVTVYVKAIPRNVTVNFKDFEEKPLGFNLSGINYILCEQNGTLRHKETLPLTNFSGKFENGNQVKNGDFIYFILDGYKTEILEITPEVETLADAVLLRMLCTLEGVVASKGTPLEKVRITIDGKDYIIFSIDGNEYINIINFSLDGNKYSFNFNDTIPTIIGHTDADGKFKLENIPQGAIINFELENYESESHTVTQDNLGLSINLKNSSESSLIVIIIASVIIAVIIIATLISVLATRKRHSYITNEHYDE